MSTKTELYDQDLYAWAQEQAARLREGAWQELDLEHLIEEIEDVGHSQQDALASHLLLLLTQVHRRERPLEQMRGQEEEMAGQGILVAVAHGFDLLNEVL